MSRKNRIPFWLKIIYTAFTAVMVWYYYRFYGPQNFLNFCDVAVLVTLVGIWMESPLLVSMQAVGVVGVQLLWLIDFLSHFTPWHLMKMTDYMFYEKYSLFLRSLSLFHGWMPILLVWLVYRLGYDRRALWVQSIFGVTLLLISYFCFAPPGTHVPGKMAVNLNLVFGTSSTTPQTTMPPLLWLGIQLVGLLVVMYVPTHLVLKHFFVERPIPMAGSETAFSDAAV